MKKSKAPSIVFKDEEVEPIEDQKEQKGKSKRKKEEAPPKVNHLDKYAKKPKIVPKPEKDEAEEASDSDSDSSDSEGSKKKGKNIPMVADSKPLYYEVTYKPQGKPEEPGLIEVSYATVLLFDRTGKKVGQAKLTRKNAGSKDEEDEEEEDAGSKKPIKNQMVKIGAKEIYIQDGFTIPVGNKKVSIYDTVAEEDFRTGKFFLQTPKDRAKKKALEKKKAEKGPPTPKLAGMNKNNKVTGFKTPFKGTESRVKRNVKPLHNPNASDAVIIFQPTDIFSENKIAVVVDPIVGKILRPHQKEGVKFLFDCLMGFKGPGIEGCILADEMGLGKTIQAVSIIWTLLKQGPTGVPGIRKACIVCPSSLVGNWVDEFNKWLPGCIKTSAIWQSQGYMSRLQKVQEGEEDVLIISYDQLKIHVKDVQKVFNIDLVICDEGHKMKNAETQTSQAVRALKAKKRIILSGTPIQNDLMEFYAMVDYANPGILGTLGVFKKTYEDPILRSREVDATPEEKALGKQRSMTLTEMTSKFILRRTSIINAKYLPSKMEYTVFCKMTPLQMEIYQTLCKAFLERIKGVDTVQALPLITCLKKLCNTPHLVHSMIGKKEKEKEAVPLHKIENLFPEEFQGGVYQPEYSAKLQWLDTLLQLIRPLKDKIVIVSNYTETLAVLAQMCKTRGYPFLKLDGQTVVKKRQELVHIFNDPLGKEFVFLLSSKAGGCGLNLIGANHLVLFDPDWNPANDDQAMARVWRPGQQKTCYLYRTLCTGSIEEKVYQRQITKKALSKSVVDGDVDAVPSFTTKDLKELFKLRTETISDTHDLLNCRCSLQAVKIPRHMRLALQVDELASWKHFDKLEKIEQNFVKKCSPESVTMIFTKFTDKMDVDKANMNFDDDEDEDADDPEGEAMEDNSKEEE